MQEDQEIKLYELRMIRSALERDIAIEGLKTKHLVSGTLFEQINQVQIKINTIDEPEQVEEVIQEPINEQPQEVEPPAEMPADTITDSEPVQNPQQTEESQSEVAV